LIGLADPYVRDAEQRALRRTKEGGGGEEGGGGRQGSDEFAHLFTTAHDVARVQIDSFFDEFLKRLSREDRERRAARAAREAQ
jgi:hypothetical protein